MLTAHGSGSLHTTHLAFRKPSVKDGLKLLLYLAGVLLLGALLAPPLFWAGQGLITHGVLAGLAHYEFDSYFHRAILVAALLLLWPLFRALHVRSWRDLGLVRNPRSLADLGAGFLIAAIPLLTERRIRSARRRVVCDTSTC